MTLTWPEAVSIMFALLMSRWTIPFSWAAWSPWATWIAMSTASSILSGPRSILSLSRSPSMQAIAMNVWSSGLVDLVDRADVRMIEGGDRVGFVHEALLGVGRRV